MDIKQRIEILKNKINQHLSNGGTVYDPKRQLPYYDYLSDTVKIIRKETGKKVSHEDVYLLCGIKFDRDFNDFVDFVANLRMFASGSVVDKIRTTNVRKINNVYERLKNYADKYNTTPFDFLTLMTSFEFSECYVKTDNYEDCLKYLISQEYPSGDISGIKRAHPDLYEQLRQLQKYYPQQLSMKSLVERLGFDWDRASEEIPSVPPEVSVLLELKQKYPKKVIGKLQSEDPTLYAHVVKICQSHKKSISQWLEEHGFKYPSGLTTPQLSFIKINSNSRKKLLGELKKSAFENMQIQSADEIDLYHASLDATKSVIEYINSRPTLDLLIMADKLKTEQQEQE